MEACYYIQPHLFLQPFHLLWKGNESNCGPGVAARDACLTGLIKDESLIVYCLSFSTLRVSFLSICPVYFLISSCDACLLHIFGGHW